MKNIDNRDIPDRFDPKHNLSFLLRVWLEGSRESAPGLTWRYSLKDLKTRAQRGFANLDSLLVYLEEMEGEGTSSMEDGTKRGE